MELQKAQDELEAKRYVRYCASAQLCAGTRRSPHPVLSFVQVVTLFTSHEPLCVMLYGPFLSCVRVHAGKAKKKKKNSNRVAGVLVLVGVVCSPTAISSACIHF